jgi:hypothetical protein
MNRTEQRLQTIRALQSLRERGIILQRVYERAGVNPSRVTAQVSRGACLNESDDAAIRAALREMVTEFGGIVAGLGGAPRSTASASTAVDAVRDAAWSDEPARLRDDPMA